MASQGLTVRLSTPLLLRLLAEAEKRGFDSLEDFLRLLLALADVAPTLASILSQLQQLREEVARLSERLEKLEAALERTAVQPSPRAPPAPLPAGPAEEALAELVEGNPWLAVIASRGSEEREGLSAAGGL